MPDEPAVDGPFRVQGRVSRPDGQPLPGLIVRAYDRDLRAEELLGEGRTGAQGEYAIEYQRAQFRRAEKLRADLVVRLFAAGDGRPALAASRTVFNAEPLATVDVVLGLDHYRGPSEYERYAREVAPLIENLPLAKLDDPDLRFLAGETEIPADRLSHLRRDAEWALRFKVDAAAFYGLFRKGISTDLRRLLAETPSRLTAAWKAALAENLVPAALGARIDAILQRLDELAIDHALAGKRDESWTDLGAWIATSPLPKPQQAQLIRLARSHDGEDDFWAALIREPGFDPAAVSAARFAVEAGPLVMGHLPTLAAVQARRQREDWSSARNLASLTRRDWQEITAASARDGELPDGVGDPAAYAEAIALQIEQVMPGAVIAARVLADPDVGTPATKAFLRANEEFDLLHDDVDAVVAGKAAAPAADRERVSTELKTLQRVARIVPAHDIYGNLRALLTNEFTSSLAINAAGPTAFSATMTPILGEAKAEATFKKARSRAKVTQVLHQKARDLLFGETLVAPATLPRETLEFGELPQWAQMFGSIGGCACADCRSVFGPAAYLADLLKFLSDAPRAQRADGGTASLLELLDERRPDIQRIRLDCSNATTALPYIDLVNEVLEDVVAGGEPAAHQTEEPSEALRARPAHERPEAYSALESEVFPWRLPFSLGLEKSLQLAEHMGLELDRLWECFGRPLDEITRAALGMSTPLWQILAGPAAGGARLEELWGGRTDGLEAVPFLLERSGLSYDEVRALAGSWFFSSEGAGQLTLDAGEDPCHIADDRLVGVPAVLDQLQRFVRLSRHLGWPIDGGGRLDGVLRAFGRRAIDAAALGDLVRVRRLAGALNLTIDRLLALDSSLAIAEALRATETAVDFLADLIGEPALSRAPAVMNVLEQWGFVRASGFEIRELAYILRGRDQAPAVFRPGEEGLQALLSELHALLHSPLAAEALTETAASRLIAENLARMFELPAEVVERLLLDLPVEGGTPLPALLSAPRAAGAPRQAAMADLLGFLAAPTPGETAHGSARTVLLRLDRIARLIRGLAIGRRELDALVATAASNGFLDLDSLNVPQAADPAAVASVFAGWTALVRAVVLRRELADGDRDLFDLLQMNFGRPDAVAILAETTGWDATTIADLAAELDLEATSYRRIESYRRLGQAHGLMRRYRVTASRLIDWSRPATGPAALAAGLGDAARQRHRTDADWYAVLTPIMDRLRERKRDALLAHVLHHGADAAGEPFGDASDVYAHYLIDVEMSSCQLSSRIVQAAAAVQLLAQRLLMNVEKAARLTGTGHDHWKQWAWMKRYRVWEANRKVFLYPENWIEPELRDDKSPFFRELETELLQDEITEESTEAAYRIYLEKLDQVAHLDVRGLYHEPDRDVLHVFARTHSGPHVYFYRQRLAHGVWTAWEKVDVDIKGDHLLPVVHNGRPMLFWATFDDRDDSWGIEIHWSEYVRGTWRQIKSAAAPPHLILGLRNVAPRPPIFSGIPRSGFFLRSSREGGGLQVELFTWYFGFLDHAAHGGMVPMLPPIRPYRVARFKVDDCTRELVVDDELEGVRFLALPPETRPDAGHLTSASRTLEINETVGLDDELPYEDLGPLFEPDQEDIPTLTAGEYNRALRDLLPAARRLEIPTDPQILLKSVDDGFVLLPDQQSRQFTAAHPFFVTTDGHCYLVTRHLERRRTFDRRRGRVVKTTDRKYRFELFFHPYLCAIVETLNRHGVAGLLDPAPSPPGRSLDRQLIAETDAASSFDSTYGPVSGVVLTPYPVENIDFDAGGAYSLYNWELFFHIPLLIADRLSKSQRFEEAQRWFHYVFDPTDVSTHPPPAKYWKVKPLYQEALDPPATIAELMRRLAAGDDDLETQVQAWEKDAFNPHLIARLRRLAYMKTVVMKYLDNLIAWGDSLFQQDTIESINEAVQLYVLAAEILGPRPVTLERDEPAALDFATLRSRLGEFANAIVDLEGLLPAELPVEGSGDGALPPDLLLYFCIPGNPKLAGYWDRVADRLFKVRNCMDLEGRVRPLTLFAPPIDPALLVRARAAGLDLREALRAAAQVSRPHHRYRLMHVKAVELAADVRALGGALLSALEKKEGEDFGLMRSRHELALLGRVRLLKEQQVTEAEETLAALAQGRTLAEQRLEYYSSRERLSAREREQLEQLGEARDMEAVAEALSIAGSIAHLIPDNVAGMTPGMIFGGSNVGHAIRAVGESFAFVASERRHEANRASIMAGYDRRQDDWSFQARQAATELPQIDRQILAAEIRLAMAEQELVNHDIQVEQSREVEGFLKAKFTSRELHGWMASQLAALHYQSYQMAYDVARKAEKAAQHELGLSSAEFSHLQLDNFESQRRGLLAGERLHHQLRRMDLAFMETNRRELEITRHISLRALDPRKLVELRETGACDFTIPELLFDIDFPGHYRRRIRSISLTIPGVTGPYTSISAMLTLTGSRFRKVPTPEAYAYTGPADARFEQYGTPEMLATSGAQNDSGLFELSFSDERYLPFEGAGAVSAWRLELPTPPSLRTFDYDTISDVIVHLRYTARQDGRLRPAAQAHVEATLNKWLDEVSSSGPGFLQMFSLRQEFSSELHRFLHPVPNAARHEAQIVVEARHFPHFVRARIEGAAVQDVVVVVKPREPGEADWFTGAAGAAPVPLEAGRAPLSAELPETRPLLGVDGPWGGLPAVTVGSLSGAPLATWALRLDPDDLPEALRRSDSSRTRLRPEVIEDILLVIRYRV